MPKTAASKKDSIKDLAESKERFEPTAARLDGRILSRATRRPTPELAPALRKRLEKDGDLAKLRERHAPLPSAATKERDGRKTAMLLVRVTDRAGATRAGVPVVVEDPQGNVIANARTDPKGHVLVRLGQVGALKREVRVRVLGAPGARSRRVALEAGKLAHKTEVRLSALPARAGQVHLLSGTNGHGNGNGNGAVMGQPQAMSLGLTEETDSALGEVESALDEYQRVLSDPDATEEQVQAAREALEEAVEEARPEEGETLPPQVEEALNEVGDLLEIEDPDKAVEAAEAAEEALEAARLAAARRTVHDVLERFRAGTATLEEVLAALGEGDLSGLSLGNDLFNQLPLDFDPAIFDLIVNNGLGLTDPLFSAVAGPNDFRRARTRVVKRLSLPRHATAPTPETRYLVRLRQEWAFLGYTLGGLLQAEPLDPGMALRTVAGTRERLDRTTSSFDAQVIRELSMETSRLLNQTTGVDSFLNSATSVANQTAASGFASVGPRVSAGSNLLGGVLGGLAGFVVGGIPGAAAGAILGSGGKLDVGGDAGGTLVTSVDTKVGLTSGVHSSLQVNSLLQSTQSLVDRQLRNLVGTLQGLQRTLDETTDRVSPLLDRVTNLLRWSMYENYAVLTQVEDVVPIRAVRLTTLEPLDEQGRQAAVGLVNALQEADLRMASLRVVLEAIVGGVNLPGVFIPSRRDAFLQGINRVDNAITTVRNVVDASALDAGLAAQLDRVDVAVDAARAAASGFTSPYTAARANPLFAPMRELLEAMQGLRARLEDLLDNDQPLFKAADVLEYRRVFEPFLLDPGLAGRFAVLRRDLELKRVASLPVHRVEVLVEHATVNAPADLRVTIAGVSRTMRLVPGQNETGTTLNFPIPVTSTGLGSARFDLDVLATPPNLPNLPGFPGGTNPFQQFVELILRGMRANVLRVRFRYHILEDFFLDQVHFPNGALQANGLAPTDTHMAFLNVPQPAVDPEGDPLVRHVNRNKAFYFGLLLRAAMNEPTLRDDAPHLKAFAGDNPIWQLPILGFEGDRVLLLDKLDPVKDAEALTWLNEPGAATLVQVPAAGAYGEALQGLLKLDGIENALHPSLQPLPAPAMPPLAVVDLTGKKLVQVPVETVP